MVTLITFLDIDDCHKRLKKVLNQHFTHGYSIQRMRLWRGRISAGHKFELQQNRLFRNEIKPVFRGQLQTFGAGTKIKGEFRAERSVSIRKLFVLGLVLLMLLSSLLTFSNNLFVIACLLGMLALMFFLEKLGNQWSQQDEQLLIDFLSETLDVVSVEQA
ncbi:MAG: hypothetical protein AAF614_13440 [Chloroflexota bacterium]